MFRKWAYLYACVYGNIHKTTRKTVRKQDGAQPRLRTSKKIENNQEDCTQLKRLRATRAARNQLVSASAHLSVAESLAAGLTMKRTSVTNDMNDISNVERKVDMFQ